VHQPFLVFQAQVLEHFGGQLVGQDAKQDGFIVGIQIGNNFGDIRRGKIAQDGAELGEVALRNQFRQFRPQQIANHTLNQP
jgi:hypothetical protein